MSKLLRNLIPPMAAMVGLLALGMGTPARAADMEIALSTSNNPPAIPGDVVASAPSGTTATYSNMNFGGFNIDLLAASSNSPGTGSLAQLTGSTLQITNTSSAPATLFITLGDTGFTSPTSATLDSHIGGTVVIGSPANSLTYSSYVNTDNAQNGTGGSTPGAQTPGITSGSFNNDSFLSLPSLGTPYSITERFALTLGAGSEINFSASSTLTPTVPEPSTLMLTGVSALCLAGYGVRRRGKA
jgi:hypothetical protein